ncbi:hypothetical protein [Alkalibacillus aidingensis]|uniref:hypothetical protein n=1 Tax=Alkalibacillus aidingensis TaxID=2747607 RepID=UPI001660DF36|nr:hypothetical protein [Alkalibacillus aidingensis]
MNLLSINLWAINTEFMMIAMIIAVAMSVMLKNLPILGIQGILATAFYFSFPSLTLLTILQFIFSAFIFYRLTRALEYNYHLILEKTHQEERYYTRGGSSGRRKTFL